MNKSLDQLKETGQKILSLASSYSVILFISIFAAMAGYLVTRIGVLTKAEPSQAQIDAKLVDLKPPKTDEEAINSIKQLQDRDISIKALFDNGRNNPFEN